MNKSTVQTGAVTDDPPGLLTRVPLHAEVCSKVRDMIVEGLLVPGDSIDERALCLRFGISRTPLREALKVLNSEGLVRLLPNRGSRVAPVTAADIHEHFQFIGGMERQAAELACQNLTNADIKVIKRLQNSIERYFKSNQRTKYVRENEKIHNYIVELSKNSLLVATHHKLMVHVRRARHLGITTISRWEESIQEHARVLAALERRDGETAGRLLMNHVLNSGESVVRQLQNEAMADNS